MGGRQLLSQGLVSVHAHRTEGVTRSKEREGAKGLGAGSELGTRTEMGTGSGAGTGTGMERERERERGWRQTKTHKMGTRMGSGAGRERGRDQGWRPVGEHRMGTGTGSRTEAKAVAEMGTGTRMGTGTGTRIGSGRVEERGRSAKNRTIVVVAMWETRETWVERGKKHGKVRVGPVAAYPDNKEAGGGAQGTHGLSKNCTSRESVSSLSRLIKVFGYNSH